MLLQMLLRAHTGIWKKTIPLTRLFFLPHARPCERRPQPYEGQERRD